MSLHIVFVEPEIPPNTGNIARTCAATDTVLHLVEPLGFKIDDKSLKRAGLDYWPYVKLEVHESLDAFMEKYGQGDRRLFLNIGTRICFSLERRQPGCREILYLSMKKGL